MRKLSPFMTYNRVLALLKPEDRSPDLHKSMLAGLATLEVGFISDFVKWADADQTEYQFQVKF